MKVETGKVDRDLVTMDVSRHGIYITLEDGTEFSVQEMAGSQLRITCTTGSMVMRPYMANVLLVAYDEK